MNSRRASVTVIFLAIWVLGLGCERPAEPPMQPPKAPGGEMSYGCPMHPNVIANRPGNCPQCGMILEPDASGPEPYTSGFLTDDSSELNRVIHPLAPKFSRSDREVLENQRTAK